MDHRQSRRSRKGPCARLMANRPTKQKPGSRQAERGMRLTSCARLVPDRPSPNLRWPSVSPTPCSISTSASWKQQSSPRWVKTTAARIMLQGPVEAPCPTDAATPVAGLQLMTTIMQHAAELIDCERCSIFMVSLAEISTPLCTRWNLCTHGYPAISFRANGGCHGNSTTVIQTNCSQKSLMSATTDLPPAATTFSASPQTWASPDMLPPRARYSRP